MNAKKIAAVALAAATTLSMSVPAFAWSTVPGSADTTGTFSGLVPTDILHYDSADEYPMYMLDSFDDEVKVNFFNAGTTGSAFSFNNNVITSGTVGVIQQDDDANFLQFENGALYAQDDDNDYVKVTNDTASSDIVTLNNGAWSFTTGRNGKSDTGFYVVWTVKPENDNYFDLSIKDNELTFKPVKYGTTVFTYTGVLYHNGNRVGNYTAKDKFAVNMPLNEDTINETVDTGLTVRPDAVPNSTKAASAAVDAINAALKARGPKMLNYTAKDLINWNGTHFLSHFSGKNIDHNLNVVVNSITDFHFDPTTQKGSYKGHVTVTDTTLSPNETYDLGTKTFTIAPDDTPSFTDVATDAWYYDAVVWGVKNGVVAGYDDGTFRPSTNVTREQVVVMLYRKAGSPVIANNTTNFNDLQVLSTESKNAIAWAVQNGIVKGMSDVTFMPKANITRGQLATILYNAKDIFLAGKNLNLSNNEDGFTDVPDGAYYEKGVIFCYSNHIAAGTQYDDEAMTFSPNKKATRAEFITMFYRYINLK